MKTNFLILKHQEIKQEGPPGGTPVHTQISVFWLVQFFRNFNVHLSISTKSNALLLILIILGSSRLDLSIYSRPWRREPEAELAAVKVSQSFAGKGRRIIDFQ